MVYSDVEITIPHKDLLNRDFVLVPLSEIATELIHPFLVNKKNIRNYYSNYANLYYGKFLIEF